MKTFTNLGSALAEDGELDVEVTHIVQSGWKNWKRVSGVLCDRRMNVEGLSADEVHDRATWRRRPTSSYIDHT